MSQSCLASDGRVSTDCYAVIVETMAEAVFAADRQGVIRFCNPALATLLKRSRDEIVGRPCTDFIVCAAEPNQTPCDLMGQEALSNHECSARTADGYSVPLLVNTRLMRNPDGDIRGAVATLTDISVLKQTQQRIEALEKAANQQHGFHDIIGHSRPMREVYQLIEMAADSNASVLITGETGTGKELAARAIHKAGPRREGPMVTVNCAALPESLLESELFGHVRGAFTGAVRDKPGRFEMAGGGTLFLDEIGELSPLIQIKLLRFLQERTFERVGENATRRADVRIITATNRNLLSLVRRGEFREDLYYRLKVFPIHLPPLRRRKEDIGALIEHFLARFNRETGKQLTGLTHEAAVTLMDYCWPGNIRELENAIEHAFVTRSEGELDLFDLPVEIRRAELRGDICAPGNQQENPASAQSDLLRKPLTRDEFIDVMRRSGWNKSEAARRMGVDRTTVWRRMKKYDLG